MTILTTRAYSGASDLQSMLDLLVAARSADRITDYPGIVDLRELLALIDVQGNTRLWLSGDNQVVGFALVDPYNNFLFEVDQQSAGPLIESQMVAWGVACIRRVAMQENSQTWTLDASCRDGDSQRIAMLERNGFVRQAVRSLHMTSSLDDPIPAPQVPTGFSIRPVAGEHEVHALVDLHRAAFGTKNMTIEERLAMMRALEYDPALDLLAVAPDGRLAAYCMCSISQEENRRSGRNEGSTDPVATHPDFQGQGLAKALLLTGLHRLKQRGIETAVLGTSSENVAMQRVAQAVGFRVKTTTLWFTRKSKRPSTIIKAQHKKDALIADLIATRGKILAIASSFSPPEQDQAFVGIWSIKDLLAHLIGWLEANHEAIQAIQSGQLPEFYAHKDHDWQTYNAHLVKKYKRDSLAEMMSILQTSHQKLIAAVESLPAEELEQDTGVRFRGYRVTIARLLAAELKDENEHYQQIVMFKNRAS